MHEAAGRCGKVNFGRQVLNFAAAVITNQTRIRIEASTGALAAPPSQISPYSANTEDAITKCSPTRQWQSSRTYLTRQTPRETAAPTAKRASDIAVMN